MSSTYVFISLSHDVILIVIMSFVNIVELHDVSPSIPICIGFDLSYLIDV